MTDTATFDRADPGAGRPEDGPGTAATDGGGGRRPARALQIGPALGRAARRIGAVPVTGWVTLAVVAGCVWFVFHNLHPALVFRENTPTGGDMGSHVWGPMYLMHHVLPHGRLTGW